MSETTGYEPTAREAAFLDTVESPRYDRQIISGLTVFLEGREPEDMRGFYTEGELQALRLLKGTERDVEARMPVKVTRHYFEMARRSPALQRLVKASPAETVDLAQVGKE